MTRRYAFQGYEKDRMARSIGVDLTVSTKQCVNVCAFLRNKKLDRAKRELDEVIALKRPVPFFRYNRDMGHKVGMASGRYPVKACTHIAQVLSSAEANAQQKGLNPDSLIVKHICAHKASTQLTGKRQRGRESKGTHIEVVLAEGKADKAKKEAKKND